MAIPSTLTINTKSYDRTLDAGVYMLSTATIDAPDYIKLLANDVKPENGRTAIVRRKEIENATEGFGNDYLQVSITVAWSDLSAMTPATQQALIDDAYDVAVAYLPDLLRKVV